MNLPLFIAKKLAFSRKNNISSTIIKIAIGAVAISVAVMIIAVFMIKGFQVGISDKMFGFWGHIDVLSYESSNHVTSVPIKNYSSYQKKIENIRQISYEDIDGKEISTNGGVRDVHRYIIYPAIIKTKIGYEGLFLKGIGVDFNSNELSRYLVEGVVPKFKSDSITRDILISRYTANRLKLKVGDKVIANFLSETAQSRKRLIVRGIYSLGISEYEKKLAFVDINLLRDILGWEKDEVGGLEVVLEDISDMDIINEYIHVEVLPADVRSMTIKSKFRAIFGWLDLQNVNERVILILMVIVSIINMITSLLILILEKTNMIGILKSMGAKNWSIRKIFLYHGIYIVGLGLLLGNLFGIGLSMLQRYYGFIKLDESSYYFSEAPICFDFWALVLINVGTLLITVISLIIPSYLVSKIDPVKAIKFK